MRNNSLQLTILAALLAFGFLAGCKEKTAEPVISTTTEQLAVRHKKLYSVDTKDLVPRIVGKLETASNRNVLRWSIQRLSEIGEEAIPDLNRLFRQNFAQHSNFPLLSNVCDAVGQIGSKKGIPILMDGLFHSSNLVRTKAMSALRSIHDPEIFPILEFSFESVAPESRPEILQAMLDCGSPDFVRFAKDLLVQGDLSLQQMAIQGVAHKYPIEGRELLSEVFHSATSSEALRLQAAQGLAKVLEPDAIAYLHKVAAEGSFADRLEAINGLGFAGAVQSLEEFVLDQQVQIRLQIVQAVNSVMTIEANAQAKIDASMKILQKLAEDSNQEVRKAAIKVAVAHGNRAVMDKYLSVLRSEPDTYKLKEAVELIIDQDIRELRAIPIAKERLRDAGEGLQALMMQVFSATHSAEGVQPLMEILIQPSTANDDHLAALHLSSLGEPAVQPLIDLVKQTKDARIFLLAMQALAWSHQPVATEFLLEYISDTNADPRVRLALLPEVPEFAGLKAAPVLKRTLMQEPDPLLRRKINDLLWDYY